MIWIETIVNGILFGGLYGLLGVGLALIVGVMRVVNISHGEFIVLAAFVGVSLAGIVPWLHPLVLLVPIVLVFFALGYGLQAVLLKEPFLDRMELAILLEALDCCDRRLVRLDREHGA